MPRRRHDDQPIGGDARPLQSGGVLGALDQTQLGLARQHRLDHLMGVADRQMQFDARMALGEGGHARRQPIGGNGLAGEQPHRAALQPRQFVQQPLGRLGPRQHGPRLGQEGRSRRVQGQAAPNPVEQPRPVSRLQRIDRRADRRLGQMQRLGRPRHVQALGHGDEDAQLFQRHGLLIDYIDR